MSKGYFDRSGQFHPPSLPPAFSAPPGPSTTGPALAETIEKVGDQYVIKSHTTGRVLGHYSSKAEAEKRLAQIKHFAKE